MTSTIGELFIALGFEVDDKTLKSFDKGVKELKDDFFDVSAGSLAALYSFDKFIESTTSGAVALVDFNQQTGESIEDLQLWAKAAHNADQALSFEGAQQSLLNFKKNLTDLTQGVGNERGFARLGVIPQIGEDEFSVLERLRKGVQNKINSKELTVAQATKFVGETGLAPNFMNLLTAPEEQFQKFIKTARSNSQTPQQIKDLKDLGTEFDQLKVKWENFIKSFTADHKSDFSQMIHDLDNVATSFMKDVKAAGEFKGALELLALAVLAVSRPLLLMVAALGYLIDDWRALKEGKDSLLNTESTRKFFDGYVDYIEKNKAHSLRPDINNLPAAGPTSSVAPIINQTNHFKVEGVSDPNLVVKMLDEKISSNNTQAYQFFNSQA